jgi:O-antigen ligase
MLNLSRDKFHYYLAILCIALIFIGLVASRVLLSVAMIVFTVNAIISPDRKVNFKYFLSSPQLWSVTIIFFVYLYSGLYSSDKSSWLEKVQIKLPFLFLPFAILTVKNITKDEFRRLLAFFVFVTFISCLYVLVRYYLQKDQVLYGAGAVMSTPFSHVRFSLIISLACFICLYLYNERFVWFSKYDYIVIAITGVLLVLFLHILAVRSGLAAFYLSLLIIVARYIYLQEKWLIGISFLSGFILMPFLAYLFIPTFTEKIEYAKYSLDQYFNSNDLNNSDVARIYSVKKGWEVSKEHFWVGVGAGDLENAMHLKYKDYPEVDGSRRKPHNQWIWIWASTGLIGVILCAFSFIYPLWRMRRSMNILFIAFITIIHTSFFTEATIEEQIGTALYLLFLLLFIVYFSSHDD